MHFGFALEFSDIDLWNTDLLDTYLDLLSRDKYTDIPSKYFVCLHKIFKMFWRHVFKTSSRHVFKTSSRHVLKTSSSPTNVCWVSSEAFCSFILPSFYQIWCCDNYNHVFFWIHILKGEIFISFSFTENDSDY